MSKDIVGYNFIDERLYNLLTDQLLKIIEPQKYVISSETSNMTFVQDKLIGFMQLLLDNESTNDKRINYLVESGLFSKNDTNSYLDQFFNELEENRGNRMFQNNWMVLTKYRNHIAHNKLLDLNFFSKVQNLYNELMRGFETFLKNKEFSKNVEESTLFIGADEDDGVKQNPSTVNDISDMEFDDDLKVEISNHDEYLNDRIQVETGLNIRDVDEIKSWFEDIINSKIDELFVALHDNGAEILTNNSLEYDRSGQILLEAKHKFILNKQIIVSVIDISIDGDKGATSQIEIRFDVNEEQKNNYYVLCQWRLYF